MTTETRKDLNFERLRGAGRNVWLAGLGAFARAEEEGREFFDQLVERGRKVESRQFKSLDRTVARTSDQFKEWGDRVQDTVQDSLQELLHRVGLPSREDLDHLSARLNALSRKVDQVASPPN
jgi:poly(hydroxyalkanoate) granule-associated protein